MVSPKKLIVGNWKMNLTIHEASIYVHKLSEAIPVHRDVEIVLAPTTLALQPISLQINRRQFKLAAQNLYWRDQGAYTGEVSAAQLRGLVEYAIIGHSERRHVFHEHAKDIRSKVQAAIRSGIRPILCVGETAHQRAVGETNEVIHDQIISGLANITSEEFDQVVIAYEPVWAIGTGKNASPDDVKQVIRTVRRQIEHLYGKAAADDIRVLYGGSVTADSAATYLATDGVNGLLVGGASLQEPAFTTIIAAAHAQKDRE